MKASLHLLNAHNVEQLQESDEKMNFKYNDLQVFMHLATNSFYPPFFLDYIWNGHIFLPTWIQIPA